MTSKLYTAIAKDQNNYQGDVDDAAANCLWSNKQTSYTGFWMSENIVQNL